MQLLSRTIIKDLQEHLVGKELECLFPNCETYNWVFFYFSLVDNISSPQTAVALE